MDERDGAEDIFLRRVLIVAAIVVLLLLAWTLTKVFLLAFAGVLVAIILRSIGDLLVRWARVPKSLSLLAASLLLLSFFAGLAFLLGAQIVSQFEQLSQTLPATLKALADRLNGLGGGFGGAIQTQLSSGVGTVVSQLASAGVVFVTGIADAVLIIFTGVFLAQDPQSYAAGFVKLFPASQRERIADVLANMGSALRLWLLGTLASMALVSVLTGIGLWIAGVPAPLALGLVAGLAEFVSFLGPIFSGVIAVLAASSVGLNSVLWALAIMIAIQQIESNMITPLIQQRAVDLPPVIGLLGIVVAGILFGVMGIIFAMPLTVVAYVAVKQLYIRDALGEATDVPGEAERLEA